MLLIYMLALILLVNVIVILVRANDIKELSMLHGLFSWKFYKKAARRS